LLLATNFFNRIRKYIRVLSAGVRRVRARSVARGSGGEAGQRLVVVPGHPLCGLTGEPVGVAKQGGQIVEAIHVRQLTTIDQAHEQVANASTTLGFVEEIIPPILGANEEWTVCARLN